MSSDFEAGETFADVSPEQMQKIIAAHLSQSHTTTAGAH